MIGLDFPITIHPLEEEDPQQIHLEKGKEGVEISNLDSPHPTPFSSRRSPSLPDVVTHPVTPFHPPGCLLTL